MVGMRMPLFWLLFQAFVLKMPALRRINISSLCPLAFALVWGVEQWIRCLGAGIVHPRGTAMIGRWGEKWLLSP